MKSSKNVQAEKAVIRARTVLLVRAPFYACLALHLVLVEDASVGTMAVDGYHMFYAPEFVLSLTEDELIGVVAHETSHCAYAHMTRRQKRHPTVWNWAGDYIINADLLEAGFTLPKKRLHDKRFNGMSTEEVYEILYKETPKVELILVSGEGAEGAGGDDGDKGGCGKVLDAAAPHDKAKADEVERQWEETVRMAVAVAKAQNAGTVPGHLRRLVDQLEEPRISWRDLTRQFIDQSMIKDYSWSRPNRRYIHQGLILPGFQADALHHLVCEIDISGSVDAEMQRAMVSEAAGALNSGIADKLTIVYFDTEVRKVDEFLMGELVTCDAPGGGGTDYVDALEWINKNAADASCVIFLTDMQPCHWNLPFIDPPVLWGCYGTRQFINSVNPPYGTKVLVDSPYS